MIVSTQLNWVIPVEILSEIIYYPAHDKFVLYSFFFRCKLMTIYDFEKFDQVQNFSQLQILVQNIPYVGKFCTWTNKF